MDTASITTLSEELLTSAREHSAGRSAHTLYGGQGHSLRQTLIALAQTSRDNKGPLVTIPAN